MMTVNPVGTPPEYIMKVIRGAIAITSPSTISPGKYVIDGNIEMSMGMLGLDTFHQNQNTLAFVN